jgi:branched-subunit amino acid transport protein
LGGVGGDRVAFFYIGVKHAIGWFLAWLFFVWFFGVALVALFVQNLWAVAGGSRLETNVAAWIAGILGVMAGFSIIKHNLGPAILGGLMMGAAGR